MVGQPPLDRRRMLETIGSILAVVLAAPAANATASRRERSSSTPSEPHRETCVPVVYSGTVDRTVDGEHVVILIEDGGRVVDQRVVPAERYPDFEEGDSVALLGHRGRILTIRRDRRG